MEKSLKTILQTYGFNFKKAYGQNFLTDTTLLSEIVKNAGVTKDDVVLEIGCGAGALTKVLSKNAKKVVGYEIDQKLKPVLRDVLSDCDNVEIVFNDVLKEKMSELESKLNDDYMVVANLPYYITTPIIMNFLEKGSRVKSMSIMVQKEVAERLTAKAGDSEYGAITVGINLRGSAKIIADVPREMFTPMPNVDSAVVKIDIEKNKFSDVDFKKVRDVVRIAFSSRRKMLVNNLMNGYKLPRAKAEEILNMANVSLTVRGEDLTASDYVRLSKVINV
ncbi:MAG: ribosomal RNA small subunit methyltransferase A [Clostridia bacterium]|nr:ribosomal RNA small subunit methyltransferase A [Clostridia bacterium]